ncbi:unnamed protein product [Parnassius mnemosyne]|uniref:RNA guanine-7 methyltransferase activating subunit n=1 Tax=Parnassius mnemosyne TaxID=213953 RepID=A0AAV1LX38_9NEOP
MTTDSLCVDDKDFLEKCEEEFKDRYTENDEDFMKIFNAEPSNPPILENWWGSQNYGRRNDQRSNRRFDRSSNRQRGNEDRGYRDRNYHQERGYENRSYQDRGYQERGYQDRGYEEQTYRGKRHSDQDSRDSGDHPPKRGRMQ